MVILAHAPSQYHSLEKCGGTFLCAVPFLPRFLSLSLALDTFFYFLLYFSLPFLMFSQSSNTSTASNYTVSQRYYWTHDHFARGWWIPDASLWFLIIVQQGTRSKGLQSHQIIEKPLMRWFFKRRLNQCRGMHRWWLKKNRQGQTVIWWSHSSDW